MIPNNQKTSLLVPSQLPEFIRDNPEYANFTLFLKAYYEWMEQEGGAVYETKNLLTYSDIDSTSNTFVDYYVNDFIADWPEDSLVSKEDAVKYAKQIYQSKGTPASYEFLFRTLYNSSTDIFNTKDAVLRASAGKWYVAKSVKLATSDTNFLNTSNLRLFGETTKSIATIENCVVSGSKIEVFISNIERLFQSGEFIRVVDSYNQDVLFDGAPLRAKIVGQISNVIVSPFNRGLLYQPGDPVVFYGGLNSENGYGASANVGTTTAGSIQRIYVVDGGFGYRELPNTVIAISNQEVSKANAIVGSLVPDAATMANVTFVPKDTISLKRFIDIGNANYHFSNTVSANANTTLANAFTFSAFSTYPISSVLVVNGGGGLTSIPDVEAQSNYSTDIGTNNLKSLGILAPIQIVTGGVGYQANDTIQITGGTGIGAYANVLTVNATGSITSVGYVYNNGQKNYPLGGFGYNSTVLPSADVVSSNVSAYGAELSVPGILGDGATFSVVTDRVGSITSISITDYGEDYINAPSISLKVQDIVISGITINNLPQRGDIVYQGDTFLTSNYIATVDSVSPLQPYADPLESLWNLRVYNYNSKPLFNKTLKIDERDLEMTLSNSYVGGRYDSTGVITYGDGSAQANASFLNGLVISQGQYLDTTGQPSSFDVLQSSKYNNYTYQLTVEKEIAKYRNLLLKLLHPTGMNVIGRFAMKSNTTANTVGSSGFLEGHTLGYYTDNPGSYATMVTDWDNKSNNQLVFGGLSGADITTIIQPGATIKLTTNNRANVYSEVIDVIDSGANTVVIKDNVWLTFANVAFASANAATNTINILDLTGSYDYINGGVYEDSNTPLKDIVITGDAVKISGNTSTVSSVDYANGIIHLSSSVGTVANSLLSVKRTLNTNLVEIYGYIGTQYIAELITENGQNLITEDGNIIILG